MLERDVENLATYFGQFAPSLLETDYGKEIWALFEAGNLNVDVPLTGRVAVDETPVDLDGLMEELEETRLEEEARIRHEEELRAGG